MFASDVCFNSSLTQTILKDTHTHTHLQTHSDTAGPHVCTAVHTVRRIYNLRIGGLVGSRKATLPMVVGMVDVPSPNGRRRSSRESTLPTTTTTSTNDTRPWPQPVHDDDDDDKARK